MEKRGLGKRGQITLFVIIAIVVVAGVLIFYSFRSSIFVEKVPASLDPVYQTFLSCIKEDTLVGIDVLESQAGYIYLPDYEAGSTYAPLSSQLNFVGNNIPYWYYISGNNVQKEQIPTISAMQDQLAQFIEENIRNCVFDKYSEEGFSVYLREPTAKVIISDKVVDVTLNMDVGIEGKNESVVVGTHDVSVNSQLGNLYNSAKEIYDYEQSSLFLENYAVDTIRLYAPVDGVEMSCSPLTWSADDVFDDLENAIAANTLALKSKKGDYSLNKAENKYFVVDLPVDNNVLFLNSMEWPHSFEVNPSQGPVLIAQPVGNQQGMGVLGFCYVPYHFVYNAMYPVLVQVYEGSEIFQFPLAVVVKGNVPREALEGSATESPIFDFCEYGNTETIVNTYDGHFNSVDAKVSYKCAGTICDMGETTNGVLTKYFPQCANGFIVASADGFKDMTYPYSSTEEGSVDLIFDKLYQREINLQVDGKDYSGNAVISFVSEDGTKTVIYPSQKFVNLSEDQYEVQVYIYQNTSINLAQTVQRQCVEVPQTGLNALFGLTEQKCFDIEVPAQVISNALAGGGKENVYILESQLSDTDSIEIGVESLPTPKTVEQLQDNYLIFEDKGVDVSFR